MKVGTFCETLKENQIVQVYSEKHTVIWRGKAGNAPLYLDWMEFKNAVKDHDTIIINGISEM